MQYRAALAVAALAPAAAAFQVTITSSCSFSVYGWNVANSYGSGPPTFTLDGNTKSWSAPFEERTDNDGGVSIKLKANDNIFDGGPLNQVEYKMAGSTLFYDLSNINGNIFAGQEVIMQTSNSACPTVNCPAGQSVCAAAYNMPDDLRTLACPGGADIEVILCGGSSGGSSSPAPAPPSSPAPAPKPTTLSTKAAPAPAATPAPQPEGGNFLENGPNGVDVVYATTVVVTTVTEHAPGAAPTGTEEKRAPAPAAHLHAHLNRGHSRFMGRHAH